MTCCESCGNSFEFIWVQSSKSNEAAKIPTQRNVWMEEWSPTLSQRVLRNALVSFLLVVVDCGCHLHSFVGKALPVNYKYHTTSNQRLSFEVISAILLFADLSLLIRTRIWAQTNSVNFLTVRTTIESTMMASQDTFGHGDSMVSQNNSIHMNQSLPNAPMSVANSNNNNASMQASNSVSSGGLINQHVAHNPQTTTTQQQQQSLSSDNADRSAGDSAAGFGSRPPNSVATLSNSWQYDSLVKECAACSSEFHPLNRRHHCRLCGKI